MRYFKGYYKDSPSHNAIFMLYDKPQSKLFGEYIIEAEYIDHYGVVRFKSLEECEELYHISREISEEEFNLYKSVQVLVTEIFMNQFTGGFPREDNVKKATHEIVKASSSLLNTLTN